MSKRISTEARLLDWIDSADIAVVVSIMSIANARVKARVKQSQPAPARVIRKPKVAEAATATAFPAGEVRSA